MMRFDFPLRNQKIQILGVDIKMGTASEYQTLCGLTGLLAPVIPKMRTIGYCVIKKVTSRSLSCNCIL